MTSAEYYATRFEAVGWFLPAYINFAQMGAAVSAMDGAATPHDGLDQALAVIYDAEHMAVAVSCLYPQVRFMAPELPSIWDAIQADALGLT